MSTHSPVPNPQEPDAEEFLVVQFQPETAEAASLVKTAFSDEEILESNAFTRAEILSVILASKDGLLKVLGFFVQHRESLKAATVKIGPKEISLQGYSLKEVQEFIDSGSVEKILQEMKKK